MVRYPHDWPVFCYLCFLTVFEIGRNLTNRYLDGYCTEINYHLSLVEFKIINMGTGNAKNNTDRVFRENGVYKINFKKNSKILKLLEFK